MQQVGFEPNVRLQILDQKGIEEIHAAVLRVLEETNVTINTEQGRRILTQAGCTCDDGNVVRIPARLVASAIETAPSLVTLYDRLGDVACPLEGWKTSYGTGSDCPFILDHDTDEKRQCTYDDVARGALVCDALEHFNFVMPVGIVSDREVRTAAVHAIEATMSNTIKPVVFTSADARGLQASIDIAAAVAGGRESLQEKPIICLYAEPTSPLKHMPEATDKLILAARTRTPVIFTPCPLMGATAPATAAGILVLGIAESLSGLVLHQLVNPGAPFIFGGVLNLLDMSTTIAPYGSPELHQTCAAMTDMAHYYALPMFGTCGCSDAKRVDAQAGLEVGFSTLMATLNGQNLIHDIGFLESALITSYEVYILANEAIGMAKHIARGVTVNSDTLGVDVIREVGHDGHYLGTDHTLRHFRGEFFFPTFQDRTNYSGWERLGRKTADVRLKETAAEIIGTHEVEPISAPARSQISRILAELEA